MFIVWRGYGILVPISVVVAFFALVLANEPLGLPSSLIFVLNGLIPGAFLWWLGRKVNNANNDKLVQDVETGEMLRLKTRHDFFWIKIEYWAVLLIAAAVVISLITGVSATIAMFQGA